MIKLTRLGGRPLYLNDDLVETLESTPDTTIQLTTGKRIMVHETPEEVLDRIVAFRRRVYGPEADPLHPTPESKQGPEVGDQRP